MNAEKRKKVISVSYGSNHPNNLILACLACKAHKKHRLPSRKEIEKIFNLNDSFMHKEF
jgi:hypothetical protein